MLDDFKNKIEALKSLDFNEELVNIIKDNEDVILKLQRGQWAKGKDRNDNPTTLDGVPNYTIYTMQLKQSNGGGLGSVIDYITGYDTGALYSALSISIDPKEITFYSDVSYWDELTERTGEDWTGLNVDNRQSFSKIIVIPEIKKIFKEKLGFK